MSLAPPAPAVAHHVPPRSVEHLPRVGGALGPAPEDFVVDELPLYPLSGSGEHRFVRLQKRGFNTHDAVAAVARAAGVSDRDVGFAGMKDRHAVTTQWLSLSARARPTAEWQLPEGLAVVEEGLHGNKLRTGHLAGNRFTLRLVGVPPGGAARAQALLDWLAQHGLRNAFGGQRFGRDAQNLPDAIAWLTAGAPARGPRTRLLRKLYPSVVQSEVFNRYLTARAALGLGTLIEGEVVRLAGSGKSFIVDDVAAEQPRLTARDVFLTGAMVGPRVRPAARGAAGALEAQVLAELGLGEAALATMGELAEGTRRDLLVFPEQVTVSEGASGGVAAGEPASQEGLPRRAPSLDSGRGDVRPAEPGGRSEPAGPGESGAVTVGFVLPPGSYATQVLEELVGGG